MTPQPVKIGQEILVNGQSATVTGFDCGFAIVSVEYANGDSGWVNHRNVKLV